jgi:hypothetical protein
MLNNFILFFKNPREYLKIHKSTIKKIVNILLVVLMIFFDLHIVISNYNKNDPTEADYENYEGIITLIFDGKIQKVNLTDEDTQVYIDVSTHSVTVSNNAKHYSVKGTINNGVIKYERNFKLREKTGDFVAIIIAIDIGCAVVYLIFSLVIKIIGITIKFFSKLTKKLKDGLKFRKEEKLSRTFPKN